MSVRVRIKLVDRAPALLVASSLRYTSHLDELDAMSGDFGENLSTIVTHGPYCHSMLLFQACHHHPASATDGTRRTRFT
jgi:hypothetical protein